MSLQDVKEQAFKLSLSDRLTLVNLIVESLQKELNNQTSQTEPIEQQRAERTTLVNQMRGFLKTEQVAPTDAEVQAILQQS